MVKETKTELGGICFSLVQNKFYRACMGLGVGGYIIDLITLYAILRLNLKKII